MESDYTVRLRQVLSHIDTVSENEIHDLERLSTELIKNVQAQIFKDATIGKAYLDSLLLEIKGELKYFEPKIRRRLKEFTEEGFDEYNSNYHNTKCAGESIDDILLMLKKLAETYYPDLAEMHKPQGFYDSFDSDLTNEELFLQKVPASTTTNTLFKSVDELVEFILKLGKTRFKIEISKVDAEIKTFPNHKNSIIERELVSCNEEFRTINHPYLIIDEVLTASEELKSEFHLLANTIYYFSQEEVTKIVKLTVQRITLLHKIEYLNSLQDNTHASTTTNETNPKKDNLYKTLKEHGFYNLEKVKVLRLESQETLFSLIFTNKLPYQIAMFNELGFLKYLSDNFYSNKADLNKKLGGWLGSDKDGRGVKGNISTLSMVSGENKGRYTAHKNKEKVRKDYDSLK